MRRMIGWLCCAALLALFGCGQTPKATNEIEVWHWMTDRQDQLEALARKYEQETGVKVKLALFAPPDAYIQKVIAAAQASVLPDIYGILDKKYIFASFIKAGYVADLTADFKADGGTWERSLSPKAIDNSRFVDGNIDKVNPGIYGVPLDISSIQMIYNKTLLKKAGIAKPPATFQEFLAAIDALKRVGIAPFVTGFGETWIVHCFAFNYAFNIMDEAKIMATFRGEVPYTDPDWVAVFTVFQTLARRGAFIEGIVTKGNKYAEQDFALGRAAFSFDGAWAVNIYKTMNPDLDYGVQALPAIRPEIPMRMWGGAGSTLIVNKASPNKNKAVAFLKWLTAKPQQVYLAEQTNNLPSNLAAIEESGAPRQRLRGEAGGSISKVLGDFAKAMDNSTHPSVWELNEDPLVVEAFDKGIQSIMIGEKIPTEIAREIQKVKVRQLGKIKR